MNIVLWVNGDMSGSGYMGFSPVHSLSEAQGIHGVADVHEAMLLGIWPKKKLPFQKKIQVLNNSSISWDAFDGASSYSITSSNSNVADAATIDNSGRIASFDEMTTGIEYTFLLSANTGESYSFYVNKIPYSGAAYSLESFTGQIARVSLFGAAGGAATASASGENGGRTIGTVEIGPSTYLYIGGKGGNSCRNTYTTLTCANDSGTGIGGWNGGANGGFNGSAYQGPGGAGGGATDLRSGGTSLSDRILIAGGAGGYTGIMGKGRGGGSSGTQGHSVAAGRAMGGMPGTQSAGGAGGAEPGYTGGDGSAGQLGLGGHGGNCPHSWCMGGGGGGAGFHGGGGGESGDISLNNTAAGGGGGSGYYDPSFVNDGVTDVSEGSQTDGFAYVLYGVVLV
jgi:hypothetical protein